MRQLTEFDLALKEDDEYLILQGRHLLRRVLNVARTELEKLHLEAQARGEVIRATGDEELLAKMLLQAAKKELKPKPQPKIDPQKALEVSKALRRGEKVVLPKSN